MERDGDQAAEPRQRREREMTHPQMQTGLVIAHTKVVVACDIVSIPQIKGSVMVRNFVECARKCTVLAMALFADARGRGLQIPPGRHRICG